MTKIKTVFIDRTNSFARMISPAILRLISKQRIILPFYHSISDFPPVHIKNLYKVKTVKDFIKDLNFLLKYYEPLDYFEFVDIASGKKKLKKPGFLLSFDDGLSEFYHIIAPLLLQKGIPAICFLNSAFIDNKGLFFRYKASLLIEKYTQNPSLFEKTGILTDEKNIQKFLLSVDYQNKEVLDKIAGKLDVDFKDYLMQNKPYLSSEQIEELIRQGFYFGSHSIDHPEYRFLNIEDQVRQTIESVEFIISKFNLDYKIFSFPFTDYGLKREFFDKIASSVDYTFGCAGIKADEISFNFQRIAFENTGLSAREIHNAEILYYIAKSFFNKNTIRRK